MKIMDQKDIMWELRELKKTSLHLLNRKEDGRGKYYEVSFRVADYLEYMMLMRNLLKVCIISLQTEGVTDPLIPQPRHNVQEVLRHLLQLMPLEEMRLIDYVEELLEEREGED